MTERGTHDEGGAQRRLDNQPFDMLYANTVKIHSQSTGGLDAMEGTRITLFAYDVIISAFDSPVITVRSECFREHFDRLCARISIDCARKTREAFQY